MCGVMAMSKIFILTFLRFFLFIYLFIYLFIVFYNIEPYGSDGSEKFKTLLFATENFTLLKRY